jgi:glycosyltransferase involved in cell wall biosynthesis
LNPNNEQLTTDNAFLKVLFLCNRVPFPPHDGGAILMYDLVSNLSRQGVAVTVLAINTPKHFQPAGVLPENVRLLTVPVNTNLSVARAFINLFKSIPYNFERFISAPYAGQLVSLLRAETFDLIQVESSHMAGYLPLIRQHAAAPVVLRAHNVEFTLWDRLARHEKNIFKKIYFKSLTRRIRAFEKAFFPLFDAIAAITTEDKNRITDLGGGSRVVVIPAGVQRERLERRPDIKPRPKTLCIIGSLNWQPNLEGLAWFLKRVWPAVQAAHPELELHIAGSFQPDFWQQQPLDQVKLHGFVPDAGLFLQHYDLMLVPLLSGGGMRVKILEGLALGKGILTTAVGAEGVQGQPGYHYLVADDAASWIRLLEEYARGSWQTESFQTRGQDLVEKLYDNKIVVKQYLDLYQELISAKYGRHEAFLG